MSGRIIGMAVAVVMLSSFGAVAQDLKPDRGRPEVREGPRKDVKGTKQAEQADGVKRGGKAFQEQADRPEKDPLVREDVKD